MIEGPHLTTWAFKILKRFVHSLFPVSCFLFPVSCFLKFLLYLILRSIS